MSDLLYLARDHDLPPRWDGHAVTWTGWTEPPVVHMCGRGAAVLSRHVCVACGSVTPTVMNTGRYFVRSMRSGRINGRRITVFRCPDCRHDMVRDYDRAWWDLDPSDYGDEGSRVVR